MKTIQCPFCQTPINIDKQASTVVCLNCCKSFSLGFSANSEQAAVKPVVPPAPANARYKTATVRLPRFVDDKEKTEPNDITPEAPYNPPAKKSGKRAIILLTGIIILAAAGAAGGIYWFKFNNRSKLQQPAVCNRQLYQL